MLKQFRKLNKQKGTSIVELMVILATASIMVGGISVKVSDIMAEAQDVQRMANLRQIVTALEIYYLDYQKYPQVSGSDSQSRWNKLISEFEDGNYLGSFPTQPENYDYKDSDGGQNYILKVLFENPENPYLEADWDGINQEIDCNDPYYCIKM